MRAVTGVIPEHKESDSGCFSNTASPGCQQIWGVLGKGSLTGFFRGTSDIFSYGKNAF